MILWLMHNRWIQVRLILCPVLLMTKGTKMKQQLDTCIMKGANCEAAASGPISSFAKNDVRKKPQLDLMNLMSCETISASQTLPPYGST